MLSSQYSSVATTDTMPKREVSPHFQRFENPPNSQKLQSVYSGPASLEAKPEVTVSSWKQIRSNGTVTGLPASPI